MKRRRRKAEGREREVMLVYGQGGNGNNRNHQPEKISKLPQYLEGKTILLETIRTFWKASIHLSVVHAEEDNGGEQERLDAVPHGKPAGDFQIIHREGHFPLLTNTLMFPESLKSLNSSRTLVRPRPIQVLEN